MTALSVCERKRREMRLHARLDLGGVEPQRNCEVRKTSASKSWVRAVALCEWSELLWGGDTVCGSNGSWGLCLDCTRVGEIIEISEAFYISFSFQITIRTCGLLECLR